MKKKKYLGRRFWERTKNKHLVGFWLRIGFFFLLSICLYMYAFIYLKNVTLADTIVYSDITISNVEYTGGTHTPVCATFSTSVGACYCMLGEGAVRKAEKQSLEELAYSNQSVSIAVIDNFFSIYHIFYQSEKSFVVEIHDENQVYLSLDAYNSRITGTRIVAIILASLFFFMSTVFSVVILKVSY